MSVVDGGSPWRRPEWRRSLASASAAAWLATGAAFFATILAARTLGPNDYGSLVLAVSIVGGVAVFLDVSLEDALIHFGADLVTRRAFDSLRSLVRLSLSTDLGIGIIVFGLVVGLSGWLSRFVGLPAGGQLYVALASLEVLARTLDGTTGSVLTLCERSVTRSWIAALGAGARVLAVLVAYNSHSVARLLVAYAVAALGAAVLQAIIAYRAARRSWPSTGADGSFTVPRSRALVQFSIHSSVATTIRSARGTLLALILGRRLGAESVGTVDVASLPVSAADVVVGPVRLLSMTGHARLVAQGDSQTLWLQLRALTVIGFGVGCAGAALGWFLLPWLLPFLFGASFEAAVPVARALLPAAIATLAVPWAKSFPVVIGRPALKTKIAILDLCLSASLVLALASNGLVLVAWGISASSAVVAIIWLVTARRACRATATT